MGVEFSAQVDQLGVIDTGEVPDVYSGYTNGGDMPLSLHYPNLLR